MRSSFKLASKCLREHLMKDWRNSSALARRVNLTAYLSSDLEDAWFCGGVCA
jgi:hypothetical protein